MAPQINISHAGSLVRGSIIGTGLVTKYLNNPSRDFTGYSTSGLLDLTEAAHQVSQRITILNIRGSYRATPSTTGFGAAGGGQGTGFGSTSEGVLETGQVTNRASRQMYNLIVSGGYQLTGLTSLQASYNYIQLSFGEQDAQSGGVTNPLFDTSIHRGSTTISTRISPRDTVGATALMSHFIQEDSGGISGRGTFTTITETLNWSRLWTQQLRTTLRAGGAIKLPVGSDIPGQSTKSQLVPSVSATMTYTSFSEELRDAGASGPFDNLLPLAGNLSSGGIFTPGAYTVAANYRYGIGPNFSFGAGPVKVHVVGANAVGGITSNLSGRVGLNYSHGTRSSPSSTFDTLGLTVGAQYLIGPVLASLTYNWLYYSREQDPSLSSQSSQYEFSKKMVLLSFSYVFNTPSFFREGISFPSGAGTGSSSSGDGSGTLRQEE
ncbi:MAG: hypothetical protein E8D41_13030 [Nitrospira sp.]|nr:MAG: hypothetical protein E8D41_13030 [Nitrospira sp.]